MPTPQVTIVFNPREQHLLSFSFAEVFMGGSTQTIQKILGKSVEAARELNHVVRAQAEQEGENVSLTEQQWRVMYETINSVINGLGPAEFQTCTGIQLKEACNVTLRICASVWGAYDGMRWE